MKFGQHQGANNDAKIYVHDRAQSFVFRSYTMHELRNQHVSTRDYQGKRVNPQYRSYIQGNSSQVIFRHCTQFFRGYYSWRIYIVSFRFKAKERKTSNAVGMSSLIFWFQARELRFSVCFNTFRNFDRSLNKRRMSPAPWTITTEWMTEKC